MHLTVHNRKVRCCGLNSIAPITPSVALRLQQPLQQRAHGRHPCGGWAGGLMSITACYRERTLAMVADTTRGSLGYAHLLRLASDGDAAAAEEESAFALVVPKYAVVDSFAG